LIRVVEKGFYSEKDAAGAVKEILEAVKVSKSISNIMCSLANVLQSI
jgi:hypothetical protein